jgi:hypothetical protein
MAECGGRRPIEAGLVGKLADHECRHDRLPFDHTPPCGCSTEEGAVVLALPRSVEKPGQPAGSMNNLKPDITSVTEENRSMRDIAIATLSGNLTREAELRSLPSAAWLGSRPPAGPDRTLRHSGESWAEATNYFIVEL